MPQSDPIPLSRRALLLGTGGALAAGLTPNRARAGQGPSSNYPPLTGNIVHFFSYGISLSMGYYGVPVISTVQPYDNLMIGASTRAAENSNKPVPTTQWVPAGPPNEDGGYSFNPLIATLGSTAKITTGETSGIGALNYLRQQYLLQKGLTADPTCQFVLTDCGIGGQTMAELSKGANPNVYNRLLMAAAAVQQAALAQGLTYQVGGMILMTGEQDVAENVSYATFLPLLQQLQQDFLADVVYGIAGAAPGTTIPWFTDQPDSVHKHNNVAIHQALLDWSNTPGSDLYMAGPLYQYPDHSVHLTANGYCWHGNQIGKAMTSVLLNAGNPSALYMTSATATGQTVDITFNVPSPPLIQGDAYVQLTAETYPNLGLLVGDSHGSVPIVSAVISGPASVQLQLGRKLAKNPAVQAGYTHTNLIDWGTNLCDSDPTIAQSTYIYTEGVQAPGENIATWNGQPLIGQPYPLNNYCAVGQVPITIAAT